MLAQMRVATKLLHLVDVAAVATFPTIQNGLALVLVPRTLSVSANGVNGLSFITFKAIQTGLALVLVRRTFPVHANGVNRFTLSAFVAARLLLVLRGGSFVLRPA